MRMIHRQTEQYEMQVPEVLPVLEEALGAVYVLRRGLIWSGEYRPVTKVGLILLYCRSSETCITRLI